MPGRPLDEILSDLTERLMAIPGVVGTAEGMSEGGVCIKVFVSSKTPELLRQIPTVVGQYPVIVEESGEFRAFDR